MPGVDLNLDLPTLGDPLSTIVAKLVTAIDAISADLAPRVTVGALDINAALDCGGNALTEVGSVQLSAGNVPTAAGSVWYDGSEFWLKDAAGSIQLTLGGQLNASSVGGITGMGATTAGVTYDLASQEFRFTAAPGTPADLTCDDLVLNGAAGTVRLGVDAAITSARTISIKSLPTSGVSLLVYKAATSTLEDANLTDPTNTVNAMTVGILTVSELKYVGLRQRSVPFNSVTGANISITTNQIQSTGTSWNWESGPLPLDVGDRVQQIVVKLRASTAGTVTVDLRKNNNNAGTSSSIASTTVTSGGQQITFNIPGGSLTLVDAFNRQYIKLSGSANAELISEVNISWDHP